MSESDTTDAGRADELYARAQIAWGRDAQLTKAAEEFAELSAEVSRLQNEQTTLDRLLEEMADARIMLEQLETDFTDEAVEQTYKEKLAQLDERLPNTEGEQDV